jgi:hypothetical protein
MRIEIAFLLAIGFFTTDRLHPISISMLEDAEVGPPGAADYPAFLGDELQAVQDGTRGGIQAQEWGRSGRCTQDCVGDWITGMKLTEFVQQPFSWKAVALFVATGVMLTFYFRAEKARIQRQKLQEQNKGVGKPRVGGPFELIDQNGNKFTSEDMKGKFALVRDASPPGVSA